MKGVLPMQMQSLNDVFVDQLEDLHSAETQLVQALPRVAAAAQHDELRQALEHHLEETRDHVRRLEEIFGQVGISGPSEHCEGMAGLLREGEHVMQAGGDPAAKDAALIAAAQRVEHYEIAAYGTVRTWASVLGKSEVASLLEETLEEEKETDQRLSEIAENFVNTAAANKGAEEEQEEGEAEEGGGSTGRPPANVSRGGASAKTRHQAADIGRSRRTTNRSRSKSR